MEDEKFTPLGLSDQLSSAQVLLQATPASAPISISRVWNLKLVSLCCTIFKLNGILFLSITDSYFLCL